MVNDKNIVGPKSLFGTRSDNKTGKSIRKGGRRDGSLTG